jgi:hypothetical protein
MLTNINKESSNMNAISPNKVVVYKFIKRQLKLDRFENINIEETPIWLKRPNLPVVCLPTKSKSPYWYDVSPNEGEVYINGSLAIVWFKEPDDELAKKAIADALTEYYYNQITDYLDKIEKAESNRTKTIEALT